MDAPVLWADIHVSYVDVADTVIGGKFICRLLARRMSAPSAIRFPYFVNVPPPTKNARVIDRGMLRQRITDTQGVGSDGSKARID